jgi:hypothetical protein
MERRTYQRHDLWLPVRVDGIEAGIAVTHNASQNGLLIVTATEAEIGTNVTVSFHVPGGREHTAVGKVVRSGRNDDDPEGLWPYAMAVEFEDPLPDVDTLRRAVETR